MNGMPTNLGFQSQPPSYPATEPKKDLNLQKWALTLWRSHWLGLPSVRGSLARCSDSKPGAVVQARTACDRPAEGIPLSPIVRSANTPDSHLLLQEAKEALLSFTTMLDLACEVAKTFHEHEKGYLWGGGAVKGSQRMPNPSIGSWQLHLFSSQSYRRCWFNRFNHNDLIARPKKIGSVQRKQRELHYNPFEKKKKLLFGLLYLSW